LDDLKKYDLSSGFLFSKLVSKSCFHFDKSSLSLPWQGQRAAKPVSQTPKVNPKTKPSPNSTNKLGFVLFDGFQPLDVFGPLDALAGISVSNSLTLSLLASTLTPINSSKIPWFKNATNRTLTFGESIVPTHNFSNPPDLDVLFVPGGLGTNAPAELIDPVIAFVKETFPKETFFEGQVLCHGMYRHRHCGESGGVGWEEGDDE
jgi:hypothetical protein